MKICTFGSCFSNGTASKLANIFGYTIVNSVVHNRSDSFISYYIHENKKTIPLKYFKNIDWHSENTEKGKNVILDQYPKRLGKCQLN